MSLLKKYNWGFAVLKFRVVQAGLELKVVPTSVSEVLGLQTFYVCGCCTPHGQSHVYLVLLEA